MTESPNKLTIEEVEFELSTLKNYEDSFRNQTLKKVYQQLADTMRENERLSVEVNKLTQKREKDADTVFAMLERVKARDIENERLRKELAEYEQDIDKLVKMVRNKPTELKIRSWHSPNNNDGGCQMPYQVIEGHCCVCGTPNRSCQPEKQPNRAKT